MCEAAAVGSGSDAALRLAETDPDLVLIADNAEQIAAFPGAVAELLARTTRLRLIVTSLDRHRRVTRAEHVLQVLPMDASTDGGIGDAGALLMARARMLGVELDAVGQQASIIEELRELAGGIPLAIEIRRRTAGLIPTPMRWPSGCGANARRSWTDRVRRTCRNASNACGRCWMPRRHC